MNLNSSNVKSVTVKAEWTQNLPDFYRITYMQDMTSTVCNSVQTPTTSATTSVTKDTYQTYGKSTSYVPETKLTDSRDNNTYTVRKLADGKCWMGEDLRLRWSAGDTIAGSDGAGGVYNFTTVHTTGIDVSLSDLCGSGCDNNKGNSYTQDYSSYNTTEKFTFYNWNAATARVGTNTSTTSISQSICAKGWKLPIGGSNSSAGSFYYLITTKYAIPNNSSGYTKISTNPFNYKARWYQTANRAGASWQYALVITASSVNPVYSHGQVDTIDDGLLVRCVSV